MATDIAAMAQYFRNTVPRCIRAFEVTKGDESDNENLTPDTLYSSFDLSCPCGNSNLQVLGFHWTNPDTGDSFFVAPISALCSKCLSAREIFDIKHHGYDAELGHGCWAARGEGAAKKYSCSECSGEDFSVNVFFDFTDDLFDDGFEKARGRECDLFHWISIIGTCARCHTQDVVCDYECA